MGRTISTQVKITYSLPWNARKTIASVISGKPSWPIPTSSTQVSPSNWRHVVGQTSPPTWFPFFGKKVMCWLRSKNTPPVQPNWNCAMLRMRSSSRRSGTVSPCRWMLRCSRSPIPLPERECWEAITPTTIPKRECRSVSGSPPSAIRTSYWKQEKYGTKCLSRCW